MTDLSSAKVSFSSVQSVSSSFSPLFSSRKLEEVFLFPSFLIDCWLWRSWGRHVPSSSILVPKSLLSNRWEIVKADGVEQEIIDDKAVKAIQNQVNSFTVLQNITKIPYKIASSFPSLIADQLRMWTNLYSLLTLHTMLRCDDWDCWWHFILASRLLAKRSLSNDDIQVSDALLMQFCSRVKKLYGKSEITPNMHMHGHLKQCIIDYDPVYNFWLFSFERYNGILEGYPTNSFSVEIKLFLRFQKEFSLASFPMPQEFNSEFNDVEWLLWITASHSVTTHWQCWR